MAGSLVSARTATAVAAATSVNIGFATGFTTAKGQATGYAMLFHAPQAGSQAEATIVTSHGNWRLIGRKTKTKLGGTMEVYAVEDMDAVDVTFDVTFDKTVGALLELRSFGGAYNGQAWAKDFTWDFGTVGATISTNCKWTANAVRGLEGNRAVSVFYSQVGSATVTSANFNLQANNVTIPGFRVVTGLNGLNFPGLSPRVNNISSSAWLALYLVTYADDFVKAASGVFDYDSFNEVREKHLENLNEQYSKENEKQEDMPVAPPIISYEDVIGIIRGKQ